MVKWSRPLVCSLLVLVFWSMPSRAQSVLAKDGNVLVIDRFGRTRKLTTSGRDSQPSMSPNKTKIAFVRSTPGRTVLAALGDIDATELWLVDSDVKRSELLISGRQDDDPQKTLAGLSSPQFSPTGKKVYFLSEAWVTSLAVHVVDIQSKVESFISPGNTLAVIQHGKYRGYLIVQKHKYFSGVRGGSYDYYWLLTPNGKEVRGIGGENNYRKFRRYIDNSTQPNHRFQTKSSSRHN
jgi:dipeptidyl aminopeptidase/acylaminoacyl peptidase